MQSKKYEDYINYIQNILSYLLVGEKNLCLDFICVDKNTYLHKYLQSNCK